MAQRETTYAQATALEAAMELRCLREPFIVCCRFGGTAAGTAMSLLLVHLHDTTKLMESSWTVDRALQSSD